MRNKFDILTDQISGNIDVMVISETKLDDSFPEKKIFLTNSFRLRSEREITTNFSSFEDKPIEALFIELNFRKNKWLLSPYIILTKTIS